MLRVPSTKWHFFFVSFGEKRGCFVWPFRVFCYIKINGFQTVPSGRWSSSTCSQILCSEAQGAVYLDEVVKER